MFVTVEFVLESDPEALLLPDVAIYERNGETVVFALSDGVTELVPVEVRELPGSMEEITAGIALGAQVVATGGAFLAPGAPVRVVEP
jgi:multidrug efflux pump subunit AcrA (membrane-fusion protein)